jgi:hypothetical protein
MAILERFCFQTFDPPCVASETCQENVGSVSAAAPGDSDAESNRKNAAMLPTKIASDDLAYKCKCFTGVAQGE